MRSTDVDPIEVVKEFLVSRGVTNGTVIVAYSGGSDSTALLSILAELRTSLSLTTVAAYLDHGIQPEESRTRETSLVVSNAEILAHRYVISSEPVGSLSTVARCEGRSLEEVAREARYRFLVDTAKSASGSWVLTAHHRDDQVETVVMRFVRGSGLSGLAGMPAERTLEGGITLLRPLLEVPRRLLYDYLSARRLDYVDDPSNAELGFDRNKVRHVLIPAILNTFPDAEGAIVRAAGRNRDAADFLTQAAGAAITWKPSFVGGDREGFEAPADEFWSAAPALRVESLLRKMNEIGEGRRAPGRLLDAVRRAPDAGGIVFEGAGWTLSQQAGRVCLVRAIVPPEECGYLFGVSLDAHETVVSLPFRLVSERRLCLPTAVVEDGLVVRSRRPGDTVRVRGRTKTLKRLLQEIGIHPRLRARVPILEDRLGVLGVYASVLGSQDVHADRLADANNSDSESSGTIEILLRTAIG